jgi:hypothetical protein
MILAIITAVLAYQRAKGAGRKGWLWAVVGAVVYIGTQLFVGLAAGVFLGIGVALFGWPDSVFDDYQILITILSLIAAIAASWLLIKFLSRTPAEEPVSMPPPPPTFGELPVSMEPGPYSSGSNPH